MQWKQYYYNHRCKWKFASWNPLWNYNENINCD